MHLLNNVTYLLYMKRIDFRKKKPTFAVYSIPRINKYGLSKENNINYRNPS